MKKRLACTLGLAAALLMTGAAQAGSQTGKIVTIYARQNDGLLFFLLDTSIDNRAPCAANNLWIIKEENSELAKKQMALLIAARTNDMPITVQGSGACTRWVNSEDVDTIGL